MRVLQQSSRLRLPLIARMEKHVAEPAADNPAAFITGWVKCSGTESARASR